MAMTCSLYEWDALSLHTLLSPATTFVPLSSILFKYNLHKYCIYSYRKGQANEILEKLWKRLPHTRHASAHIGIPLYAGYANRAELFCQKLLQGRHFPSATENQDHAANGQPIDISTTYEWILGALCAVSLAPLPLPLASRAAHWGSSRRDTAACQSISNVCALT